MKSQVEKAYLHILLIGRLLLEPDNTVNTYYHLI